MSHSGNFNALLDACVLYPASVRDLLLSLAEKELYRPKWTDRIQEEWRTNLEVNRPDIPSQALNRTIEVMNTAFPDAVIENYETLIPGIILPDENDRHVLAAAIKGKADVIVTSNIRDFLPEIVSSFDIEVTTPDDFILHIIDLDPELAIEAVNAQMARLKNPPQSFQDLMQTFEKNGLHNSVRRLRELKSKK